MRVQTNVKAGYTKIPPASEYPKLTHKKHAKE